MIKISKLKFCGTAVALLLIAGACQKSTHQATDGTAEKPTHPGALTADGGGPGLKTAWYPAGTIFKESRQGYEATPPKGWSYIGTTIGGGALYLKDKATSSVTCTCNMGIGSCKPFEAKGPWGTTRGCTGTCTNCTMSQSTSGYSNYSVERGGYFNPGSPSRLLRNGEAAPALFEELAALPGFQRNLKAFLDKAYDGKEFQKPVYVDASTVTAPKGHVLVGAVIMGRGVALILPEGFVQRELGLAYKTKATCKCSNKTGECKLQDKTILGMGSIWCDGTCNGCTLTTTTNATSPAGGYEVSLFASNF